ncbi:hypothetical protein GCM10010252_50300 [Streptomyces aureoverticillatus]|nr:hypothetical protein GCM10010252_50300 [Streptomyces aureoverticillatus]
MARAAAAKNARLRMGLPPDAGKLMWVLVLLARASWGYLGEDTAVVRVGEGRRPIRGGGGARRGWEGHVACARGR